MILGLSILPSKSPTYADKKYDLVRIKAFISSASAYVTLINAGLEARPLLESCDRMPNFHSIQLMKVNGTYSVPAVIGATYRADKLAMNDQEYQAAIGAVGELCGREAELAQSPLDMSQTLSDSDVREIREPGLIINPSVFTKIYEAHEYGLKLRPRYWDPIREEEVEMTNMGTQGEIMGISEPCGPTNGLSFVDTIIGVKFEKKRLVMIGWMPMKEYIQKAVKMKFLFQPHGVTERLIMPFAATCWRPMIDYLKQLKGFENAMKEGLIVASQ